MVSFIIYMSFEELPDIILHKILEEVPQLRFVNLFFRNLLIDHKKPKDCIYPTSNSIIKKVKFNNMTLTYCTLYFNSKRRIDLVTKSSYDPFEEAKKRAQAKILSTTTINLNSSLESNPRLESKLIPESNPDFNLSPRELFKKALSYDDDNQNMLAIKYYILCIKKYLEENKIITMKFIRTVRNAFGNLAILLDIEEIKTDFIEIGYKFGICGGNYNLLQCYAEYFRNKAYLLEYLLILSYCQIS